MSLSLDFNKFEKRNILLEMSCRARSFFVFEIQTVL